MKKARKYRDKLPYNRTFSERFEKTIGSGKWTRTEKSRMSREWTRMWTHDDMMFWRIDQWLFRLSKVPPEDKYNTFPLFWEDPDRRIRELFPPFSLMRCSESLAYGEDSIEKKYSILCPIREISSHSLDPEIRLEFSENISETRLRSGSIRNREWESHSRSRSMVWILSEDDHLHLIEWCCIIRSKDVFCFWITASRRIFFFYKCCQTFPVWFLEFIRECLKPRWMDTDSHGMSIKKVILFQNSSIYWWSKNFHLRYIFYCYKNTQYRVYPLNICNKKKKMLQWLYNILIKKLCLKILQNILKQKNWVQSEKIMIPSEQNDSLQRISKE